MEPKTIAYIAAFFSAIGYLPQAIKTIRTKDTKAMSFWMYLCALTGVVFWFIFGLMIKSYPILLKNSIIIILSGTILFIKTSHIIKGIDDKKNFKKFMKIVNLVLLIKK